MQYSILRNLSHISTSLNLDFSNVRYDVEHKLSAVIENQGNNIQLSLTNMLTLQLSLLIIGGITIYCLVKFVWIQLRVWDMILKFYSQTSTAIIKCCCRKFVLDSDEMKPEDFMAVRRRKVWGSTQVCQIRILANLLGARPCHLMFLCCDFQYTVSQEAGGHFAGQYLSWNTRKIFQNKDVFVR